MQTTSHILMIRPAAFTYNAQTAVNNAFQLAGRDAGAQEKALREFDAFVALLRANELDVWVIDDTPEPHTPDSIFPNNWISFHEDGRVFLYPMYAANRRLERKQPVLTGAKPKFSILEVIDLSGFEEQGKFLEGTGSMVLDRDSRIAYACISPRTDEDLLQQFCEKMHYRKVAFTAVDSAGNAIYHTNVLMCVGDRYVVICLQAIPRTEQRKQVEQIIHGSGKELIEISAGQMNRFAGNMLQVENARGEKILVMSSQAYGALDRWQVEKLEAYNPIIHSPLDTIETNGGGSARCMMAEVHLPIQK